MERLSTKLKTWTSDFLENSEEFLIDIESKPPNSKYKIVIDGIKPVSIYRCSELSRHLSKLIDEDKEIEDNKGFTLEVSSPGAEKPLKFLNQYFKHIGRKLEVEKKDKTKITGVLKSIESSELVIEKNVSKKETTEEKIEFNNIEKAIVIITFK
ncbi:MAG: ribosome maturation factor RimP [Bacteroidia bacterium]|nr:ribosome maturation factor RimP [Bacteroidia bacterium]